MNRVAQQSITAAVFDAKVSGREVPKATNVMAVISLQIYTDREQHCKETEPEILHIFYIFGPPGRPKIAKKSRDPVGR